MRYEAMARKHWEKFLPELTAGLKKEGLFEKMIKSKAEMARKEIGVLVSSGTQMKAAEEMILPEYILLPPETM